MKYLFTYLLLLTGTASCLHAQETKVVYFGFNKANLHQAATDTLKAWIAQQMLSGVITLKGHTDISGSKRYNRALSARRANVVATVLRSACVACSLQVRWFGEDSTVSLTQPALNRRVEIMWTPASLPADTSKVVSTTAPQDTLPAKGKTLELPALKNIYFVPNQAVIESFSQPYVQELASLLRNYPVKALFEIRGHVNCSNSSLCGNPAYQQYLDKLSEDRAKEVYKHLIDLGVPASIMSYQGMGQREMVFPDPQTEEQMHRNMRVEVIVFPQSNQ